MNKKSTLGFLVLIVVALGGCDANDMKKEVKTIQKPVDYIAEVDNDKQDSKESTLMNGMFTIEDEKIMLKNGVFEKDAAPGTPLKEKYTILSNMSAVGDLNGDNVNDEAGILILNSGGSGVFAYLVAKIDNEGTNGVFIGDRIEIKGISIDKGIITVVYMDRGINEPMATTPTISKTRNYIVVDGNLQEKK